MSDADGAHVDAIRLVEHGHGGHVCTTALLLAGVEAAIRVHHLLNLPEERVAQHAGSLVVDKEVLDRLAVQGGLKATEEDAFAPLDEAARREVILVDEADAVLADRVLNLKLRGVVGLVQRAANVLDEPVLGGVVAAQVGQERASDDEGGVRSAVRRS